MLSISLKSHHVSSDQSSSASKQTCQDDDAASESKPALSCAQRLKSKQKHVRENQMLRTTIVVALISFMG